MITERSAHLPSRHVLDYPILLIGPLPPPKGGVSIHIERLSRALLLHNWPHSILDESRQETPGIPNFRRITWLGYIALLRRHRLVHIHSSNHFVRLLHALVAKALGLGIVHTVHSSRGGRVALAALRYACRLGQSRIGVSEAVAETLGQSALVIPAFIPPNLEDEDIPADIERWLNAQVAQGRRIIAMNAFNTAKIDGLDIYGLDMIVEAFLKANLALDHAAIVCVSMVEPEREGLRTLLAKAALLNDCIRFVTGEISFPGVLRRCDVFIRPTITDGDAISVREALWYGKPAIASDAVARPHGTILFASRDVQDFARKILDTKKLLITEQGGEDFSKPVIDVYEKFMSHLT